MIGDIKGYCILKSLDDVFVGWDRNSDPKGYEAICQRSVGTPLRILDVAVDNSGFLALDPQAVCLLDIRSMDSVSAHFLCGQYGDYLVPPGLDIQGRMAYALRCMTRKGGYNDILRRMVIAASLHSGEFDDRFLWT